ncbi:MAG: glycerophosphoryl diester phosphodiesterase [Verrucomicrobiales bacterium]|jgi:glycerophosphoryl diester phosphodiesterase
MTLVIAHRGASKAFTENTIDAFRGAAEMGADWVELDVRRTACGAIVVHHDATTADGRLIRDQQVADLPEHISTLEDVIDACGEMGVHIEIKNDPTEDDFDPEHLMVPAIVKIARAKLSHARTLITSFDMGAINAVHDVDPKMPTGFVTEDDVGPEVSIGRASAHAHTAVSPSDDIATNRWIGAARDAGLAVYVWTVDDPKRMKALAKMGVDGIITNVPDVARKALR